MSCDLISTRPLGEFNRSTSSNTNPTSSSSSERHILRRGGGSQATSSSSIRKSIRYAQDDEENLSNANETLAEKQQLYFDNLLMHSILRGFFDVPAIFSLRRVCKSFHRIIGNDSIVWSNLMVRWGGLPSTPWLRRAHPCLSKLALFRDRCYLERIIPLKEPIRSIFNDQYRCTIRTIGFTPKGFFLGFKAEGDMSSGPLQSPWPSLMDIVVNGIIQIRKRPDRVELMSSSSGGALITDNRTSPQRCLEGYLFFDNVPFERLCFDAQIHFMYGSVGYSSEVICELTRLFCRTNRLLHLLRGWINC